MNAQQLRNSILQQAIQGKLVPQDPTDEPASVLLQRIRKEKERLVKEGKLKKKDLEIKPIEEDEIPFEIPKGWEWASLFMLSLDSADGPFGSNLKREHYTENKEVRIIQLSNIGEEGWRDFNKKYTTFEHLKSIKRSEAFANDIIIAKMMPAGRAIICPECDKKYVLSSDAVRFDFSSQLYRKYLYYAINSKVFKDQVYGEVQGITRVRTSLSKLRTYMIPLPPLAEQRRIVAKIEELMPLVERYGKAQQALDQLNESLPARLRQSILQEAIQGRLVPQDPKEEPASELLKRIRKEKEQLVKEGKLKKKDLESKPIEEDEISFEIPKSWEWVRLKEVISLLSGQDLEPQRYSSNQQGIPYITGASCFKKGSLILNRWTTSPTSVSHKGDLLITCKGTVGTMAFNTIGDIHIARQIMAISSFGMYMPYLQYFMEFIVPDLEKKAHSIIPGISRENVQNCLVPLPPLSEQKRIVAKVEELFGVMG